MDQKLVKLPDQQHPHLTARYESPDNHAESIAEIAALLTRGPVETLEHLERVQKIQDKETLRTNATYMQGVLGEEASSLRSRIDAGLENATDEERLRNQSLLNAIDAGDEAVMRGYGLSFQYAWMNDIVATIINGELPVEIETVGPYAAVHINPKTDKLEVDIARIPPNEMAGIVVASLLRKIDPVAHNTRVVSLLDELNNFTTGRDLTSEEQNAYVAAMAEFYGQAGVLKPEDVPGEDFIILRESELAKRVDELERELEKSGQGTLETVETGERYFMPSDELVDALALHSANRIRELKKDGILLRRSNGSPTCQAMDAAGFLNPINAKFMHVVMIDHSMEAEQDKTYALLKALGTVKQERYHNIFFDSQNLSPEVVAYGIAKTLERHTATFINALEKYDEWEAFNPYKYVENNYSQKILEEDAEIITTVTAVLKELGIAPGSLEAVADVGSGPNLYPSMLMVPYLKEGAKIDMLEYSLANRDYMTKLVAGELPPEHARIWQKFEALMIERGGDIYNAAEAHTKQAANIEAGNIFELPEAGYDLISSYFVAESIVDSNLPFREAIQSLAKAVKPDGTLIIAHMLESGGYDTGKGVDFPAVKLTVEDLKEAYKDAGLEFTIIEVGENAQEKAREGYEGMALVVAKRKT